LLAFSPFSFYAGHGAWQERAQIQGFPFFPPSPSSIESTRTKMTPSPLPVGAKASFDFGDQLQLHFLLFLFGSWRGSAPFHFPLSGGKIQAGRSPPLPPSPVLTSSLSSRLPSSLFPPSLPYTCSGNDLGRSFPLSPLWECEKNVNETGDPSSPFSPFSPSLGQNDVPSQIASGFSFFFFLFLLALLQHLLNLPSSSLLPSRYSITPSILLRESVVELFFLFFPPPLAQFSTEEREGEEPFFSLSFPSVPLTPTPLRLFRVEETSAFFFSLFPLT